jgi:transketolase C-terminal domain/subunit
MAFVGVNDVFGESGSEEELYARHGLTAQGIIEKVLEVLGRKGGAG